MACSKNPLQHLIDAYDNQVPLQTALLKHEIETYATHPDSEIRMWVAKGLVHDSADVVGFLLRLAKDEDEAVRLEAVDSLSAFATRESFHALCAALADSDPLVRAYAACGVAEVGAVVAPEETAGLLRHTQTQESCPRVLTDLWGGLYHLGDADALNQLMALFHSGDYQVQCTVLQILIERSGKAADERTSLFLSSLTPDHYLTPVADLLYRWRVDSKEDA